MSNTAFPAAPALEPPTPGLSRYAELASDLRGRILGGQWQPGDALSAESELARSYGVALGTMRQAIALLVEQGLLERRHGKGTFVKAGMGGASMLRFFRFGHADSSQPPGSRILSCKEVPADATAVAAFGLAQGAPVLALERLRSIAGQPCLLESIVLPLPLFKALAKSDPASWGDLLYPAYQQRCGVVVHQAQDHLSFGTLGAMQARRLGLAKGHPCVRVRRRAYDLGGRCVELRVTLGDAFDFEYTATVR
jgi:GntR family transcriptional regulator